MSLDQDLFEQVSTEPRRLAALDELDILDTSPELAYDRICQLIKLIFDVEIGIVSMIDAHRQWYKSVTGLDTTEASLDGTFCRYTLQLNRPIIVPDATKDPRFSDNPHVTGGPLIRFYAGAPITTSKGLVIGTICAIDSKVRDFSEREASILVHLAALVMHGLELRRETITDTLTGAGSRRAFKDESGRLLALANSSAMPLSCLVLDVDYFKRVNDTHGHAAGDQVLTGIVTALKAELRQSDFVGRVGGEEFAILLPQTELETACQVAEQLRDLIKALQFAGGNAPIKVTASIGVAGFVRGDDIESLLARADSALYEAKRTGRDKVCRAGSPAQAAKLNRRRVLKAGQIIFHGGKSVCDCTIRSVWDNGAEVNVSVPAAVPDRFELLVKGTSERHVCTLVSRAIGSIEASFS